MLKYKYDSSVIFIFFNAALGCRNHISFNGFNILELMGFILMVFIKLE